MKKISFALIVGLAQLSQAQFKIQAEVPSQLRDTDAILYTLDGSKDIVKGKYAIKGGKLDIKYPENYMGMLKLFFPNTNNTIIFISENKDVQMKIEGDAQKFSFIQFLDDSNKVWTEYSNDSQRRETVLSALVQIQEYYGIKHKFGQALEEEISRLNAKSPDYSKYPFIDFYNRSYQKYMVASEPGKDASVQDIVKFINNSGSSLESSGLLRPILLSYLNKGGNDKIAESVDAMLNTVNVETSRGQTILSEFIDIFDVYSMGDLKKTYLEKAKALKCTIFGRLDSVLKSNANVELGAKLPNYIFKEATNTKAKTLHDIKADYKVIFVWASTCSHCEKELPTITKYYQNLKQKNIEVVGLSLDTDKSRYMEKISALPWVNDSQLMGWRSVIVEDYNLHATPTYFILDKNNKIVNKPDHFQDVLTYFNIK